MPGSGHHEILMITVPMRTERNYMETQRNMALR